MSLDLTHFHRTLLRSLIQLGQKLDEPLPDKVVEAAIVANPWFTPYYIQESIAGVRKWLTEETLLSFLSGYSSGLPRPHRVGVIAAGNLPLVGFHDVLMTLLSGHIVYLKCAHRDQVLMRWIRNIWVDIWPELAKIFHEVEQVKGVDFLVATGSNNSARYIQQAYPDIPKILRHHRYSVAWLTQDTTDEQLIALNRDLFLYNGLGCRNVSSLLVDQHFDLTRLQESLHAYPAEELNPYYLERVLYVRELYRVLGKSLIHTPFLLLQTADEPQDLGMGIVSLVSIDKPATDFSHWSQRYVSEWQCIVGKSVSFGQTQSPDIDEFADGIDTYAQLIRLGQEN